MPPLPLKSITVAGHRVRIKIDPETKDWADYDPDKKTISVHPDTAADPTLFRKWVRHEIGHAALTLSGVAYTLKDDNEEAVIRCLDEILYPAIDSLDAKLNSRLQIKPATE
jgi:hypothetical protein